MNHKSDTAEVVHIYKGTTEDKVDALITDVRHLLSATERFHAQNSSEHHHIEGRLQQVESVLHSLASKLDSLLSVLTVSRDKSSVED
jgi:hypothetical protein